MTRITIPVGALLTCGLMQSCLYDGIQDCADFCNQLDVDNHWTLAPEASPEGMAYFFFPKSGSGSWRFDIPGKDGGDLRLPLGDYAFITINDDTSVIFENDKSFSSIVASTLPCDLLSGAAVDLNEARPHRITDSDQKVVMCPDMLWGDYSPYVSIGFDELSYEIVSDGSRILTSSMMLLPTHPRQIVSRYHFIISNVANLEGVSRMCAAMSGMAADVSLCDLSRSSVGVTLPFAAVRSGESEISGEFMTFGLASDKSVRNVLYLFVWLTDGSRHSYEFDVTSQTLAASDPMDVWVRVDSLDLPLPDDSQETFDVSVDQWNTVVINIGKG